MSVSFTFENIYSSGNFKAEKHGALCRNVMLMLRSIAPAINFKNSRKIKTNYSLDFLRSFYLASLTFGCLFYSPSTVYPANDNSEKENIIRVYSHGIAGFTDQGADCLHDNPRWDLTKSKV